MLTKKLLTLLFLFICTFSFKTHAQDKIVKTNADTIICKIKEVLHDEVKYILPDITPDVVFGIDKNEVKMLIFANGKTMLLEHSMYGSANYKNQRKKAFKLNFLAPLTGNTTISYEKLIKPTRSWEVSLGIIGLGTDINDEDPRGAFAKFGIKFIRDPDFYLKGMRYAHVLKGAYFKPEIALSVYSFDSYGWYYWYGYQEEDLSRKTNYVASFNLILGKQWVFNDRFLFDYYFGAGYGFGEIHDDRTNHFGFLGADGETPITFVMGFKVGMLFK